MALGIRLQCHGQLPARSDIQLPEHLAQVIIDRRRTNEELSRYLWVREPFGSQKCDTALLRGEIERPHRLLSRTRSPVIRSSA